jgi:hypothetical protein
MVGSITQLVTYDAIKQALSASGGQDAPPPAQLPFAQLLGATMLCSVVTVTTMNPFDVVATRMYQSAGVATAYRGPWDCAVRTVRAEGLRALAKGWTANLARLGPHTVLSLLAFEKLKRMYVAAFPSPGSTAEPVAPAPATGKAPADGGEDLQEITGM